jgi:hypothetical protein
MGDGRWEMGVRMILDFGFCGSRSGGSLLIERDSDASTWREPPGCVRQDKTGFWIENPTLPTPLTIPSPISALPSPHSHLRTPISHLPTQFMGI